MLSLTIRLIDDPAELDLALVTPDRVWATRTGARAVSRRGPGRWHWRNEDGYEGMVPSRSMALTMLALHCPDLRHLTALPDEEIEDAASGEPAPAGG